MNYEDLQDIFFNFQLKIAYVYKKMMITIDKTPLSSKTSYVSMKVAVDSLHSNDISSLSKQRNDDVGAMSPS